MITFFRGNSQVYVVQSDIVLSENDQKKLYWLFGKAPSIPEPRLSGWFVGPRKEMITPWSTNAVEITCNMGIEGIFRIEEFFPADGAEASFDPMLQSLYQNLDQEVFDIDKKPEEIIEVADIKAYNEAEGLALSDDEIEYLEGVSKKINRSLTDSEVFGFSQVNSEHCRHKIFNGTFIIDGEEMGESLFSLIKKTSKVNPNTIVSAYKDNVAFILGPEVEQFAPASQDKPDFFETRRTSSVISLKAETHNFPTTVEPFNGAATGSGGEIRDRMAGGKASMPLIGTAVYMTSYPRMGEDRNWENHDEARNWLYQTPRQILVKASNGASDFGNKFGQPLLCGSLMTFEHLEQGVSYGYDKVIMQAGGVGTGNFDDAQKDTPEAGDVIVVLGGDNYRIGMGGGAVSSVATGEFDNRIELNAVQRSNPEMQKRVYNAIRAMAEADINPIVSIHDHGAGGHLNSLSELVEELGGKIDIDKLPLGDPTLSAKEIIGNESQERMGLIIKEKDLAVMERVAERERAPFYPVGKTTGDYRFVFNNGAGKQNPIDLDLAYMFGKPPKTVLSDKSRDIVFDKLDYQTDKLDHYIRQVLRIEAVACKDWLTNKVDRSVTGRGAVQQCAGEIQLPVNDLAVVALDYRGGKAVATAIGHAPVAALINEEAGSRLAVAEALTNMIWAPLKDKIKSVSLSANWMWPAKNPGENARLYRAVKAVSDFCCDLGINVPTGKDSMSMTQKYPDGKTVFAPGTVIISSAGEVPDIKKTVPQVMKHLEESELIYVDFSDGNYELGGSSLAQILNKLGQKAPDCLGPKNFALGFNAIQELIEEGLIHSGHDVSAGGLVTCLLEMCFPNMNGGVTVDLDVFDVDDPLRILFTEQPAIVIQTEHSDIVSKRLNEAGLKHYRVGRPSKERTMYLRGKSLSVDYSIDDLRDNWFYTSYLFDRDQCGEEMAAERYKHYKEQPLDINFPANFSGLFRDQGVNPERKERSGISAAIIREKGVNGDREMAYAMHLAGFDVKDVHMTDLISGREDLADINFIVFVGGFSNSDVLGSAKGWAGAFLYNPKARESLEKFYAREDTLSLGICNGCQVMMELDLIHPKDALHPKMLHNASGKFESAFLGVSIEENNSVMFGSLSGSKLGVWVAHGEGKFWFPEDGREYNKLVKFRYSAYPGNPNGSPEAVAAICSDDGRHLAMMPHLERSFVPWQWAHYPDDRTSDECTPWLEAFVNARNWVKKNQK
ncbi:MAG: phosphoribosylformylglycinamidine synthase [Bacteroidetes bacterium]|nr:phosphoribosylformylglycinamidine synthase [Bacteroidota bacterium]MBT7463605.1 phosphoribosylformylglycinamidine synthase [Bacteroidota bacterium]